MKEVLGVIAVLATLVAASVAPVGEGRLALPQQVPPAPPPPTKLDRAACSPTVPCCPAALAQWTGPPCRVGCPGGPPKKVRTLRPDLTNVAKPYPTGVVILELTINEQGVPVSSCVLRGIRADFDKAAQVATLGWRFEPKLLKGKPVGIVMTVTVDTHKVER